MKIIIVGGVAGGASAAARARRLSEDAEIILFDRGPDVSFANCGLPYYIGGEIVDRGRLLVTKPALLIARYRLDVRTLTQVESIDRTAKTVTVRNLKTGQEYTESYDKLILAPGAAPLLPAIPGVDLPGVYTLRDLQDVDRIKEIIDGGAKHVAVIGAGFIGLELVENLVRRGVAVTLIELQNQVLPPIDREMTSPLLDQLKANHVDLRLGVSADQFERNGDKLDVRLTTGEHLSADLVLLGIGVRPENGLAIGAGLEVGPRGGIKVDEHMRTADADIYAVGDAVEIQGFVMGNPTQVPLAGPANRQGRIAADHIFGLDSRFRGTQGTAIVRVFDQTVAATGESEKSLQRSATPYKKIYVHPMNHAGYYPGAKQLTIKLLFEPESGRILGAQAVGQEGVDKRIDVLATAIQYRGTVFDLEEAELAYAPQFGSAKDPINMAGFVAAGIARGDYTQVHVEDLEGEIARNAMLVDVRTAEEFRLGHIPNAINLPIDEIRGRFAELPRDRRLIVNCQVGQRGYLATRLLRHFGFDASNLSGGYRSYRMAIDTLP